MEKAAAVGHLGVEDIMAGQVSPNPPDLVRCIQGLLQRRAAPSVRVPTPQGSQIQASSLEGVLQMQADPGLRGLRTLGEGKGARVGLGRDRGGSMWEQGAHRLPCLYNF